jgi:hypothetical protein
MHFRSITYKSIQSCERRLSENRRKDVKMKTCKVPLNKNVTSTSSDFNCRYELISLFTFVLISILIQNELASLCGTTAHGEIIHLILELRLMNYKSFPPSPQHFTLAVPHSSPSHSLYRISLSANFLSSVASLHF